MYIGVQAHSPQYPVPPQGLVSKSPRIGLSHLWNGQHGLQVTVFYFPSACVLLEGGDLGVMTPRVPEGPDVTASAQPVSTSRETPTQPYDSHPPCHPSPNHLRPLSVFCTRNPGHTDARPRHCTPHLDNLPLPGQPGLQLLMPSSAMFLGSPRSFQGLHWAYSPFSQVPSGRPPLTARPPCVPYSQWCLQGVCPPLASNLPFGQTQPGNLRGTNSPNIQVCL